MDEAEVETMAIYVMLKLQDTALDRLHDTGCLRSFLGEQDTLVLPSDRRVDVAVQTIDHVPHAVATQRA
jgi:hypothetical protein